VYGATLKTQLGAVHTTPEQFDRRLQLEPGATRRWFPYLVPDRHVPRVVAAIQQLRQELVQ
jgi:hypothetical protein